ncbi:hypothetical protein B0H14DRAFT_2595376 [Mycena olivaceomarginata]|nr:hypothetical protein B0H14DRAFT_2595376 [Mycena olivaceomarginata]
MYPFCAWPSCPFASGQYWVPPGTVEDTSSKGLQAPLVSDRYHWERGSHLFCRRGAGGSWASRRPGIGAGGIDVAVTPASGGGTVSVKAGLIGFRSGTFDAKLRLCIRVWRRRYRSGGVEVLVNPSGVRGTGSVICMWVGGLKQAKREKAGVVARGVE